MVSPITVDFIITGIITGIKTTRSVLNKAASGNLPLLTKSRSNPNPRHHPANNLTDILTASNLQTFAAPP